MIDNTLLKFRNEYLENAKRHVPRDFASMHEGYAVIKEELDEAWEEIKHDNYDGACREMIQVGAMALRFIVELKGKDHDKLMGK